MPVVMSSTPALGARRARRRRGGGASRGFLSVESGLVVSGSGVAKLRGGLASKILMFFGVLGWH